MLFRCGRALLFDYGHTTLPDNTATAGSWAGVWLVNWDLDLLQYWTLHWYYMIVVVHFAGPALRLWRVCSFSLRGHLLCGRVFKFVGAISLRARFSIMDVLMLLVHFPFGRAFEFVGALILRARFRCGRAISSFIFECKRAQNISVPVIKPQSTI
jgi:hypothetical protein